MESPSRHPTTTRWTPLRRPIHHLPGPSTICQAHPPPSPAHPPPSTTFQAHQPPSRPSRASLVGRQSINTRIRGLQNAVKGPADGLCRRRQDGLGNEIQGDFSLAYYLGLPTRVDGSPELVYRLVPECLSCGARKQPVVNTRPTKISLQNNNSDITQGSLRRRISVYKLLGLRRECVESRGIRGKQGNSAFDCLKKQRAFVKKELLCIWLFHDQKISTNENIARETQPDEVAIDQSTSSEHNSREPGLPLQQCAWKSHLHRRRLMARADRREAGCLMGITTYSSYLRTQQAADSCICLRCNQM